MLLPRAKRDRLDIDDGGTPALSGQPFKYHVPHGHYCCCFLLARLLAAIMSPHLLQPSEDRCSTSLLQIPCPGRGCFAAPYHTTKPSFDAVILHSVQRVHDFLCSSIQQQQQQLTFTSNAEPTLPSRSFLWQFSDWLPVKARAAGACLGLGYPCRLSRNPTSSYSQTHPCPCELAQGKFQEKKKPQESPSSRWD